MTRLFFILLGVVFITSSSAPVLAEKGGRFSGTVTHIIDGDTFQVTRGRKIVKIRLWGIDAPEWDQPYAREITRYLHTIILHKKVKIQYYYTDDYNRLVATLTINGFLLNQLLIEKGYAWVYERYCDRAVCQQWKHAEKEAKINKKGLWRTQGPTPPWLWKKMN